MKKFICCFALVMSLSACVNPMSGLQKSGDYSVEKLKHDGTMVAVITSAISNETEQATLNYDAVLARTLTDKLSAPVQTNNCLSNTALQQVSASLRTQTVLSSDAKDAITASKCSARYLIIARIERDEINQHRDVRQDYMFIHREPGMVMPNDDTVVEVDFTRNRKLVSAFWVIDRMNGESVWSAGITESEPNISRHSRVFPSLNMLNQLWADDYIKSLPENNDALYPPPVAREVVWETLCKTFAKHLNQ